MKKLTCRKTIAVSLWLLLGATVALLAQHATKVYFDYGGDKLVVASGGELDVESGGSLELAGTAITSTAAELNILDGVTSTAAELNTLDGVTSTAAELNILDGVLATAAQINAVTGASLTGAATTSAADSLAIPVTHRVVAKTTGADAEALTLANGVAGQRLLIYLGTDGGGDGTLTPTTKSGFATIVFADAGDFAELEYVNDTVGWILVGLGGVAAPPAITV